MAADFPFRKAPESFKRKINERKEEAEKGKAHFDSSDIQNIKNKLGLRQGAPEVKVIRQLNRLRYKNKKTLKAIGLTEADFKKFGIVIEHR